MPNLNINHYLYKNFIWSNEDGSVTVRLITSRDYLKSAVVVYGPKPAFKEGFIKKEPMEIVLRNSTSEVWQHTMFLEDKRYVYYFLVTLENGQEYLFNSLGLYPANKKLDIQDNVFQFCHVFDSEKTIVPSIAKKKGAVIQIFPDRFAIGDFKKRSMKDKNIEVGDKVDYRSFFAGDLKGIENHLDYLQSIGISTIYLTPIFKSSSNHRYDVEDYFKIDPRLGGDKALKSLVKALHEKGMSIVLDAVFNHTSYKNPLFQDVVKYGKKSKFYHFYFCQGKPSFKKGNYLRFAYANYMPKLDTSNPEVISYCTSAITYITKKFNIDGWRFDVADEMAHLFFTQIRFALRKINPTLLLIGEDWLPSENYLEGQQFDGVMNYQFRKIVLDLLVNKNIDSAKAKDLFIDLLERYSWNNDLSMFNLLSSHDTPRFKTLAKGSDAKTLLAILLGISYPGMFMSYYGDEIGMEGGRDPDNRRPMDWEENHWDIDFHKNYVDLLQLKQNEEFVSGFVSIENQDDLLLFKRWVSKKKVFTIVLNPSDKTYSYSPVGDIKIRKGFNKEKNELSPYGYLVFLNK